ncbi:MAG TPA: hypothetical protein VEZ55_00855, partial [Chitinophagaceae bacterium]|nr:hypothetical protein [Chitinophagaceae bacterium]
MPAAKFQIPQYTSKDLGIMVATMLPLSVLFSIFLFGNHYFADLTVFLVATVTLFFITGVAFFAYGYVAIIL